MIFWSSHLWLLPRPSNPRTPHLSTSTAVPWLFLPRDCYRGGIQFGKPHCVMMVSSHFASESHERSTCHRARSTANSCWPEAWFCLAAATCWNAKHVQRLASWHPVFVPSFCWHERARQDAFEAVTFHCCCCHPTPWTSMPAASEPSANHAVLPGKKQNTQGGMASSFTSYTGPGGAENHIKNAKNHLSTPNQQTRLPGRFSGQAASLKAFWLGTFFFFGSILGGDKDSSTGCLILFCCNFLHHFFLRRPILEPAYLFGLLSTCANVVLQALLSGIDDESAWSGRAAASCNATASAVAGKMFLAFWCGGGPSTTSLNSKTVPQCLQERVAAMCPWDQIYYSTFWCRRSCWTYTQTHSDQLQAIHWNHINHDHIPAPDHSASRMAAR